MSEKRTSIFYQCGIAAETDNTTSAEGHIHMLHNNECQKNNKSVGASLQ